MTEILPASENFDGKLLTEKINGATVNFTQGTGISPGPLLYFTKREV